MLKSSKIITLSVLVVIAIISCIFAILYVSEDNSSNVRDVSVMDRTEHYSFVTQIGKPHSNEGLFENPRDSAVDSAGNVFVVGATSIQKFSSEGKFITQLNNPYVRPFIEPGGIAIDSKDNVYVADHSLKIIQKFSSDGKIITKWGTEGAKDGQFENISGIAIDSEDNVYVADEGYVMKNNQNSQHFSRIQKFTNDGKFIEKLGLEGVNDGQFVHTFSIDVDSKSVNLRTTPTRS